MLPTLLYTCWTSPAVGAYVQEKVRGGWVDRRDIPVTLETDDWNCEKGYTNASVMHVTLPVQPLHKVYTFRIMVPEREGWKMAVGSPVRACVKISNSDHEW